MDLKQIRCFLVVCEKRSLSRAVDVLGISQPSLSRQIQLLEASVKHHLLRRTGRGVEPTEAGLRFLEHAKAIDRLVTVARQDMGVFGAKAPAKVRLGLPHRIARRLGPQWVATFRSRFPEAAITLAEGLSSEMTEWLAKGRIDLALLYDPLPSSLMVTESLYREELVLAYGPATHPPPPPEVRADTLGRYPMVLPSAPNTIRELVDRTCREGHIALDVVAEVDVVQTILETLSQGDGYTIIPRSALDDMPGRRRLACSAIVGPAILNDLTLALPAAGPASPLVAATADIIRELDIAAHFAPAAAG